MGKYRTADIQADTTEDNYMQGVIESMFRQKDRLDIYQLSWLFLGAGKGPILKIKGSWCGSRGLGELYNITQDHQLIGSIFPQGVNKVLNFLMDRARNYSRSVKTHDNPGTIT